MRKRGIPVKKDPLALHLVLDLEKGWGRARKGMSGPRVRAD